MSRDVDAVEVAEERHAVEERLEVSRAAQASCHDLGMKMVVYVSKA